MKQSKRLSILDSLGSFFKPEFLNRFDSIIEFNSLEKEHILQIVDLMINELQETLTEQNIELTVHIRSKRKISRTWLPSCIWCTPAPQSNSRTTRR